MKKIFRLIDIALFITSIGLIIWGIVGINTTKPYNQGADQVGYVIIFFLSLLFAIIFGLLLIPLSRGEKKV
jgi:hypothetical protein